MKRDEILQMCNTDETRKNFWNGKDVLVTGAYGLLGSWLTHVLVGCGARVTIIIRDETPDSLLREDDTLQRVTIVRGSFTDYELVERVLFDYEITHIFHLGAQTQVRTANRQPRETFESNIKGTWNILEAGRISPTTQAILLASSDKAYGSQDKLPYTEETPLEGRHPYDVSKSCADLLATAYFATYNLPVCTTRCGNLYGPGDLNFDRLIPGTVRSVLRGETPIIRSDGTFIRDYFFIPDAVDGYLTVAEQMDRKEVVGEAFNLSIGNKVSVLELFTMILKAMGSDAKPKILNEAKNEIKEQSLSSEKAERILNWKARHTLNDGLGITIDWYKRMLADD